MVEIRKILCDACAAEGKETPGRWKHGSKGRNHLKADLCEGHKHYFDDKLKAAGRDRSDPFFFDHLIMELLAKNKLPRGS